LKAVLAFLKIAEVGFARGRLFGSGVRPFDFAQGRLSLRMTTI
jgi:hypothetical protein